MLTFPLVVAGIIHSVVIAKNIWPKLAQIPLDARRTFRGRRLFGSNKTLRGIVVMSGASAFAYLMLTPFTDVPVTNLALFGGFTGLLYSVSELPNSFLKRQLGVGPGSRPSGAASLLHYTLDQFDSAIGIAIGLFVTELVSANVALWFALLGGLVHCFFDFLLHVFGVKKSHLKPENVPLWLVTCMQVGVYVTTNIFRFIFRIPRTVRLGTITESSCIIAANHVGQLDPVFATSAMPWRTFITLAPFRFVTKDAYISAYWQQILLLPFGCIPAKHAGSRTGLSLALDLLAKGQTVFTFPEGKIRKGDRELSPKPGLAYMAKHSQKPILPIWIEQSGKQTLPRWVIIGKPEKPGQIEDDLSRAAQALFKRVTDLTTSVKPYGKARQMLREESGTQHP